MANQTEKGISLVLVSFLSLFLELVFIRWLPSNVLSLAYFSNIVLISSFFGLGLGCLLASKIKDLFRWFPLTLLVAVAIIVSLRRFEIIIPPQDNEWIWSYYGGNKIYAPQLKLGILSALSIVYILNASIFALIGQKIGLLMENFKPIKAYSLNLIGSILGIVFFGLLSFINGGFNSPQIWFMIGGIISLWFLKKDKFILFIGITCLLIIITTVHYTSEGEIWSPYYNIQIRNYKDESFVLFVNR